MCSYNCCVPKTHESQSILAQLSLLKLISEESRLKIICILRSGKHNVSELLEHVDLSQSLVSHHLADLKTAGIVQDKKDGRQVFYSLTQKGQFIVDLLQTLSQKEDL